MKAISIIYLMSVSLCASLCCPEEDDYFPATITIENDSLISIENNQIVYNVDDSIYIRTEIANQQETIEGSQVILSDYDYAEVNQSRMTLSMSLYKLTAFNTVVKIPLLEEHIEIIEGDVYFNGNQEISDINILSIYNGEDYKSMIGIKLLEAGTYYIGASYGNNEFVCIEGGDYNTSWISIKSKIVNANQEGFFEFTVN